jgi:hypothetical protein
VDVTQDPAYLFRTKVINAAMQDQNLDLSMQNQVNLMAVYLGAGGRRRGRGGRGRRGPAKKGKGLR